LPCMVTCNAPLSIVAFTFEVSPFGTYTRATYLSFCSRRSTDAAKADCPKVELRFRKLCAKMPSSCLPSSRSRNCTSAKCELVGNGVIVAADMLDEVETDGVGVAVAVDLSEE